MRRPTGDQEVAGSTSAEVGNIHSWRLRQKSLIRTKQILDCLTIFQNICEVVTVKTVELKVSQSQRIWPAPVILI